MATITRTGSFLALGALICTSALFAPGYAQAAPNCGTSPLGNVTTNVRTSTYIRNNVGVAQVALVNENISDHSYADVVWGYTSGDATWVDRSTDGGTNWAQCGPFYRKYSNSQQNRGYSMRACMRVQRYAHSFCTTWFYDNG